MAEVNIFSDALFCEFRQILDSQMKTLQASGNFEKKQYNDFNWLEYSIEKDAVFCFPCRFFGLAADDSLTRIGFRYWKHARGKSDTFQLITVFVLNTIKLFFLGKSINLP